MEGQSQKSKMPMYHQNHSLPQDIITSEILIKLPVKSLVRFKSVCKEWESIISSPTFSKSHLIRTKSDPFNPGHQTRTLFIHSSNDMLNCQSISFDQEKQQVLDSIKFNISDPFLSGSSVRVVGSCNGLVCFYLKQDNCFCLWNPCIGEFSQVTFPKTVCLNSGFGFVSGLDDYKIVAIGTSYETHQRSALVYSVKVNKWSDIGGVSDELAGFGLAGVLVDETLYWASKKIIGFNLRDDSFYEVPMNHLGNSFLCMGLCALDGSLCAWDYDREGLAQADVLEMCMFKYQSSSRCWTKLFKLDVSRLGLYVRGFFGSTATGKVIVQRNHEMEVELFAVCPDQSPPNFGSLVQGAGHVVSFCESLISPSQLLSAKSS